MRRGTERDCGEAWEEVVQQVQCATSLDRISIHLVVRNNILSTYSKLDLQNKGFKGTW